ncbi:MAG: NUDIX domain-containing protein [Planctomycetota bacterium]|nr:NUDIX domain-containing protein [Planctomycetota bacterium]
MPSDLATIDHPIHDVGAGTQEDPRLIVELWLPIPVGARWELLMCRRVPARGGFWQGVSGRVEASDASLRHAALRELGEELQLGAGRLAEVLDLEQTYDFASLRGDRFYRKHCMAVLLSAGTDVEHVTLSEEHDECVRMTFEQAIDLARFPEYVTELESLEARLYAR